MGRFIKGDIVVLPFPFSDLSDTKKRPALVITALKGDDVILCMITSQAAHDDYAVSLASADFVSGKLPQESNIRPNRLFTADSNIILNRAGAISKKKLQDVIDKILQILNA